MLGLEEFVQKELLNLELKYLVGVVKIKVYCSVDWTWTVGFSMLLSWLYVNAKYCFIMI